MVKLDYDIWRNKYLTICSDILEKMNAFKKKAKNPEKIKRLKIVFSDLKKLIEKFEEELICIDKMKKIYDEEGAGKAKQFWNKTVVPLTKLTERAFLESQNLYFSPDFYSEEKQYPEEKKIWELIIKLRAHELKIFVYWKEGLVVFNKK